MNCNETRMYFLCVTRFGLLRFSHHQTQHADPDRTAWLVKIKLWHSNVTWATDTDINLEKLRFTEANTNWPDPGSIKKLLRLHQTTPNNQENSSKYHFFKGISSISSSKLLTPVAVQFWVLMYLLNAYLRLRSTVYVCRSLNAFHPTTDRCVKVAAHHYLVSGRRDSWNHFTVHSSSRYLGGWLVWWWSSPSVFRRLKRTDRPTFVCLGSGPVPFAEIQ